MSSRPRRACIVLLALFAFARPEAVVSQSLYDLLERSLIESEALLDARAALDESAEDLRPGIQIDSSRLTVSSSVQYRPDEIESTDDVAPMASANLTVPLFPQIGLTGSLSTDFESLSSSFSVSVSPFSPGAVDYRTWETYEKSEINLISLSASLPYQYEAALHGVITGTKSLELNENRLAYQERNLDVKRAQYEVGQVDFTQLDQATSSHISAQRAVIDSERALLAARLQLINLIGLELGSTEFEPLTIGAIEIEIERRRNALLASDTKPVSVGQLNNLTELRSLERQFDETPLFDPDISISASSNLPFSSVSGSVSITLSPDHWQREDRDDILELIDEKKAEIDLESKIMEFELDMLRKRIASVEKNYESSIAALTNAKISYDETLFYYNDDERTDLELEEAKINLNAAEINRYGSAIDLLETYGEYIEYLDISRLSAQFIS